MNTSRPDDHTMIAASETAKRNPMRPPDTLQRPAGAPVPVFVRHPSCRVTWPFLLSCGGIRLSWGTLHGADALGALASVAYLAVNEWLIHVFRLHYEALKILGRPVDFDLPVQERRPQA